MTENKKKFVISHRSTGLGDCIVSLIGAWRYARVTNRTLVIDWRRSRYVNDQNRNAFITLFEPISEIKGTSVICDDSVNAIKFPTPIFTTIAERGKSRALFAKLSTRFPFLFRFSFMSSIFHQAEVDDARLIKLEQDVPCPTVLFLSCLPVKLEESQYQTFLAHLRPQKDIQEEIDQYAKSNFDGNKIVSVHIRHGNSGNIMNHSKYWLDEEQAIKNICNSIKRAQKVLGGKSFIFLCTDSQKVLNKIKKSFPNVIAREKYFRSTNRGELHARRVRIETNAFNSGKDALIEMFLLSKGDALVCYPPDSYFSFYARHCQKSPPVREIVVFKDSL